MAVQTGPDKIRKTIYEQICKHIRQYRFETGGIIGVNEQRIICDFRFDNIISPAKYEYLPNTHYLNEIINSVWMEKNISFVGFVHSHLHTDNISQQDINYVREILKVNSFLEHILVGVINLEDKDDCIRWFLISMECVCDCIVNKIA